MISTIAKQNHLFRETWNLKLETKKKNYSEAEIQYNMKP